MQRLDKVTQNEARWTAVQTLQIVYGLVENVKFLMDGKANPLISFLSLLTFSH